MSYIGVDLGATKILGIRADERGTIEERVLRPTEAALGPDHVIEQVALVFEALLPPGGIAGVDGFGLGTPGPMYPASGVVSNPPNLPGWNRVPLRDLVEARLGFTGDQYLAMIHDGNAGALAEHTFGAARRRSEEGNPVRHLVYLTVSTGVGGGAIVEGSLLLGANGLAAELGHIVIDYDGPLCNCGNTGCLEAMASGTALARDASQLVASGRPTTLLDAAGGDPGAITAKIVARCAQEGDQAALELMDREGTLVGVGVVSLIHTFNPQLVVIGGGVSNAGDLLFDPLRAAVEARIQHPYRGTFEITPASLGPDVGALGAVAAAQIVKGAGHAPWRSGRGPRGRNSR